MLVRTGLQVKVSREERIIGRCLCVYRNQVRAYTEIRLGRGVGGGVGLAGKGEGKLQSII